MIFDSPFMVEAVLPFLLVFVIMFAILQKSKILGEGKSQIDALVSLVIGLILIGVPGPRGIIVALMPWLAVGVSVILVFLILYGFVVGDLSGNNVKPWMKITFGILAGIFTVGVVVYVTGLWKWISSAVSGASGSGMALQIVMIVIIGVAIAVVLSGSGKGSDD
ncbi:hypothetical protein HOA55_01140 [archaeon]|jgi:hypothetical protein|nr:hypothetical protein [archaeon]MBT3577807.1 hypothetical protein [archaeon]MBT6819939.1 hypothetical protein [archaeon]MBT6955853.1 hypothetical protein [archaeon]MBT7025495.1 hypothetical protein [archaeon]